MALHVQCRVPEQCSIIGCPRKTQILRFLRENYFFVFCVSNTKFAFLWLVSTQANFAFWGSNFAFAVGLVWGARC